MSVLRIISEKAGAAGLPLLVIGGYAVMAHGFVRATDDLDLLVQASRRDQWRGLMEVLGMSVYREAPAFMLADFDLTAMPPAPAIEPPPAAPGQPGAPQKTAATTPGGQKQVQP